ncbi:MAG: PEP-CTERM sorting domain-containing protein [Lentisphaeria bacterium]|nr:PEP-CTERM sorting domain-containing protein [Lentisphaeria bacterium]
MTTISTLGRILAVTAALTLEVMGGAAKAAITAINSDYLTVGASATGGTPYNLSFDAGANATGLIAVVTSESNSSSMIVRYNGVDFDVAQAHTGSNVGIYYLNDPSTGGAFNFTVQGNGTTINFLGAAIVSVQSTLHTIVPTQVASETGNPAAADVAINVPDSGSFVMAGFNLNNGASANTFVLDSPLTEIFSLFINSGGAGAGYQENVAAGINNYSYTYGGTLAPRTTTAASFMDIPEPSSMILTGLGLAGLCFRRVRK